MEGPGLRQYEYIDRELPDLFALADIVLSRAGANAVFELLALHKPAVLVPLPLSASRGDQILNARYFEKKGFAKELPQEEASPERLTKELKDLYAQRNGYISAMEAEPNANGTGTVLNLIFKAAKV